MALRLNRRLEPPVAAEHRQGLVDHPADDDAESSPDDLAKLADAIIAATSSRMFLGLHNRMGWDVAEAADLSMWIVGAIHDRYRTEGAP